MGAAPVLCGCGLDKFGGRWFSICTGASGSRLKLEGLQLESPVLLWGEALSQHLRSLTQQGRDGGNVRVLREMYGLKQYITEYCLFPRIKSNKISRLEVGDPQRTGLGLGWGTPVLGWFQEKQLCPSCLGILSFRSQLKCHLLRDTFPYWVVSFKPILLCNYLHITIFSI